MSNGLITKTSPINFRGVRSLMPQMMSMMSQKYMTDLRNKNMLNLLKERMGGYEQLETQRHESTMKEIKYRADQQIRQDAPLQQIATQMYDAQQAGNTELLEALRPAYNARIEKIAMPLFNVTRGQQTPQDLAILMREYNDPETIRSLASTGAASWRAGETMDIRGKEHELDVRELKEKQLGRTREEDETYYTRARDRIRYAMDHLEAQGVKKSGVSNFMALFSSGKTLDPLSSEDQGQALSGLFHLWNKVSAMKRLSPQEESWMESTLNAFGVRERGGVADMETGLTGPETGRVDTGIDSAIATRMNAIDERLVQMFKEKYMAQGIAEPEADRMARQDVAGLSGIQ